ncbi:hypothetical protein F4821DRAFT_164491 [Hypoxylon rubiginosum]|uniref:Uncharacterized protein n=1 Tax=Hypoxylon rubiginosum TaxID=110542 RepID=A0ACC0CX17_9PEZI|nr:hypothetical protein F4821DRAFT_164491 [Hypoxylon rubiginosum]
MFVTLRCNKDGMSVENVPTGAEDGTRPRHSACNSCRIKKLKCSGDRRACSACVASKTKCTYSPSTSQSMKARRYSRRDGSRPSAPSIQDPSSAGGPDFENAPTISVSKHPSQSPGGAASPVTNSLLTPCPTGVGTEAGEEMLLDALEVSFNDEIFSDHNWTPSYINGILDGSSGAISGDIEGYSSPQQQDIPADENLTLGSSSPGPGPAPPWILGVQIDETVPQPPQSSTDPQCSHQQHPTTPQKCTCLLNAIIALEKLEILGVQDPQTYTNTVDGILSLNKNVNATCNAMLDCPSCRCLSSHVMLLILISRGLALQFERLHAILSSTNAEKAQSDGDPRQHTYSSTNRERNMSFGTYSVDTSEEWKSMLHALAVIQGKSLRSLLERVRGVTSYRNWVAHQTLLDGIEPRHRNTMISLQLLNSDIM